MAITRKALVTMFLTRRGTVEALRKHYCLPDEYVDDCLRDHMSGVKPQVRVRKSKQMTIAEVYGSITV